jgi:hypothetical protein
MTLMRVVDSGTEVATGQSLYYAGMLTSEYMCAIDTVIEGGARGEEIRMPPLFSSQRRV